MNLVKCDLCGVTSDAWDNHTRKWRTLDVRRAHGWSPAMVSAGAANLVKGAPDTWPGYERWFAADSLKLHFCSEACLLGGLRKLHEGAQIVGFGGFGMRPEAFSASLQVTLDLEQALPPGGEA